MPTYEYECTVCEHRFEVVQSFHDKPRSRCPECRSKVRKVFHPAGIIFKGSGWYVTDSRSSSEKAKFTGDGKAPAKTSSEPVKAGSADKKKDNSQKTASKSSSKKTD